MRHLVRSVIAQTLLLLVTLCYTLRPGVCQTYQDTVAIIRDKVKNTNYSVEVVPKLNQSEAIKINASFSIGNIAEVNDVTQSFICNGVFNLIWTDELLAWTPSDYGGRTVINPQPKLIWRPRMILSNTLGDRDLFQDDSSPASVEYTGLTTWIPGSMFPLSCKLDMTKYPFDQQKCIMTMYPMAIGIEQLEYVATSPAGDLSYYEANGEWDLIDFTISTGVQAYTDYLSTSYIQVNFKIKRRPAYFVINIILPVVLLSALNLLVFTIPVESGEKIGYGITVLLALSVYLSLISGMLPRSSDNVPLVTVYLFILFVISVLTVIATIAIAFLHHLEVRKDTHRKAKDKFKSGFKKCVKARIGVQAFENERNGSAGSLPSKTAPGAEQTDKEGESAPEPNYYKIVGKCIDLFLFFVFGVIWIIVTMWFFIHTAL